MTRTAAYVLSALIAASAMALATAPAPAVAQQDIMQCMERCLRTEGRDQRDTCRLRCADIPSVTGPGSRPAGEEDCMGRFKACQKECGRNKECISVCKTQLMNCK